MYDHSPCRGPVSGLPEYLLPAYSRAVSASPVADELPGLRPVFPGAKAGIRRIGMRLSRRPTIEACFTKGCPHLKFVQCSVRRNRICDLAGKGIGYLRVCPLEEACAAC